MHNTFYCHLAELNINIGSPTNAHPHHVLDHFRGCSYIHVIGLNAVIRAYVLAIVETIILWQSILIVLCKLDSLYCFELLGSHHGLVGIFFIFFFVSFLCYFLL